MTQVATAKTAKTTKAVAGERAPAAVLTIGKTYLCKYKSSLYSAVFEIEVHQYSPNGTCLQYTRRMGDKYNNNSQVLAWVETEHFWSQYELLDTL